MLEITLRVDYSGGVTDDDLRTMLREFRTSVTADLDAQHRRLDVFSDEVRARIGTAETSILNEIRSVARRIDSLSERLKRIEES